MCFFNANYNDIIMNNFFRVLVSDTACYLFLSVLRELFGLSMYFRFYDDMKSLIYYLKTKIFIVYFYQMNNS